MEISKYCFTCENYNTKNCKKEGYVNDMQGLKPDCHNLSILCAEIIEYVMIPPHGV